MKYVKEVIIDKNFNFTPGRPLGNNKMCYPDHYGIIFVMENIPLANGKARCKKYKIWNLKKDGGWNKYNELTDENKRFNEVSEDESKNPTVIMDIIEKELTKVKFKAFGKVSVRNELLKCKELKNLQKEKYEVIDNEASEQRDEKIKGIEDKITEKVLENQRLRLEKELGDLKSLKDKKEDLL